MSYLYFVIFSLLFCLNLCFNIDVNSPYFKSITGKDIGLFGFSLNTFVNQKSGDRLIIIGAPSTRVEKDVVTGSTYVCPITKKTADCEQLQVSGLTKNSLFGYSVTAKKNSFFTCAPGHMSDYYNTKYVGGKCWEYDSELNSRTLESNDCLSRLKKNSQNKALINCFMGAAVDTIGNDALFVTSPYALIGKGELLKYKFRTDFQTWYKDTSFIVNKQTGKYQLTGSSMTKGSMFRDPSILKTMVMGGPSIAMTNFTAATVGQGIVMFVKVMPDGKMEYAGKLIGYKFGSGYGYSVLLIDLNGDGFDDLVVGAPYISNNMGAVYVYWNTGTLVKSSDDKETFMLPLDTSNPLKLLPVKRKGADLKSIEVGQFGNCIENIGDINKDGVDDMAIGAPFQNNGSGSVYLYLGNKNKQLSMFQKIEGASISANTRGFGFSIHGRGVDLDSNGYPDILVGAALTNEVFGLRSRPLIKINFENLVSNGTYVMPISSPNIRKCDFNGEKLPCLKIVVSLSYSYVKKKKCPTGSKVFDITWTLELDKQFVKENLKKRVVFSSNENIIKKSGKLVCTSVGEQNQIVKETMDIYFLTSDFFNASTQVTLELKVQPKLTEPPKRNIRSDSDIADLTLFPALQQQNKTFINEIFLGEICRDGSCHPKLSLKVDTTLKRQNNDEYLMKVANEAKFDVSVAVTNLATEAIRKADFTYIKIDFDTRFMKVTNLIKSKYKNNPKGIIYEIKNPLNAQESEKTMFKFVLLNEFLQSGESYLHVTISISSMYPQPHLKPITIRIKMIMVVNVDLKVNVEPATASFSKMPILGFSGIKSEEKIGTKFKMKISLANRKEASVVIDSKLVIFFPWEIVGNKSRPHGQYLLYLLQNPKFAISTVKRKIVCDIKSLKQLVNPIGTRLHESTRKSSNYEDVELKDDVEMPKKFPTFHKITEKFVFTDSDKKSDMEKTILLSCLNGTARCVPIVCDIGTLSQRLGEISMRLDFRMWLYTMIENFSKYKSVQIQFPVYWLPSVNYEIVFNSTKGYEYAKITVFNLKKPKPSTRGYIISIIASVVAGVFVLGIIIFILYKRRFFERKRLKKKPTPRKSP